MSRGYSVGDSVSVTDEAAILTSYMGLKGKTLKVMSINKTGLTGAPYEAVVDDSEGNTHVIKTPNLKKVSEGDTKGKITMDTELKGTRAYSATQSHSDMTTTLKNLKDGGWDVSDKDLETLNNGKKLKLFDGKGGYIAINPDKQEADKAAEPKKLEDIYKPMPRGKDKTEIQQISKDNAKQFVGIIVSGAGISGDITDVKYKDDGEYHAGITAKVGGKTLEITQSRSFNRVRVTYRPMGDKSNDHMLNMTVGTIGYRGLEGDVAKEVRAFVKNNGKDKKSIWSWWRRWSSDKTW